MNLLLGLLAAAINKGFVSENEEEFEAGLVAQTAIGMVWLLANPAKIIPGHCLNDQRGWPVRLLLPPEDMEAEIIRNLGIDPEVDAMMSEGFPPISLEVFCDNGIPTFLWPNRPCANCKKTPTLMRRSEYGGSDCFAQYDDPCIEGLHGIQHACCGHGKTELAYLHFDDDSVVRGDAALAEMRRLGGTPLE